jgi:RNA polymerase sigma-70 factor (ECF subfamily)
MSSDDRTSQLQRWIDRLQAGDPAARDRLLESAAGRLRRLARKMLRGYPGVRRWEETDDVLQNALVRLWRALQEVPPHSARHFLHLAALQIRRELLDLARHWYGPEGPGAHHATPGPGAGPGPEATPPPAYESPDHSHEPGRLLLWAEFHTQVDSLPDKEREVFDLLWYQGLTQAEVAGLLGVSDREVRRRWRAARLRIRRVLPGELQED